MIMMFYKHTGKRLGVQSRIARLAIGANHLLSVLKVDTLYLRPNKKLF